MQSNITVLLKKTYIYCSLLLIAICVFGEEMNNKITLPDNPKIYESEAAAQETLAIPIYPDLSDEQIEFVAATIRKLLS